MRVGHLKVVVALGVVISALGASQLFAAVKRVDKTATGLPEDGSTWARAYRELRTALIASVAGDDLWVAANSYTPGTNATSTFNLKNSVRIYGGFPVGGGDASFNARNPAVFITVLSGDLGGGVTSDAIVTGSIGINDTAILDGFTISGGETAIENDGAGPKLEGLTISGNTSSWEGAGMLNFSGSTPVIRNCLFRNNQASDAGGAMYNTGANTQPNLTSCTFENNTAGSGGGAVFNQSGAAAVFNDCMFSANHATASSNGGAIFTSGDAGMLTLRNCSFENNTAYDGGAMHLESTQAAEVRGCIFQSNTADFGGGAGIYLAGYAVANLIKCTFKDNETSGGNGGGAYLNGVAVVTNCRFLANDADSGGGVYAAGASTSIANSAFSGNTAMWLGGGMFANGDFDIINCTFVDNLAADGGGGGISHAIGNPRIRNCIFWENRAGGSNNEAGQMNGLYGPHFYATNTCIQGLNLMAGFGNIASDPLFVSRLGNDGQQGTGDENLTLQPTSPCLDVADNGPVPADSLDVDEDSNSVEPTPDLSDKIREQNVRRVRGLAGCGGRNVDMGAHEYIVDCDGNSVSDEEQIASNLSLDVDNDGILDSCQDCDGDGTPDSDEIATHAERDCNLNCIPDSCDIGVYGTSQDANSNGIPDECEDCNHNGIGDWLETDCNGNTRPDDCDIATGFSADCNRDLVPDECEVLPYTDCNHNCVPDVQDIGNVSSDCNGDGIPDECEHVPWLLVTTNADFDRGVSINVNHDVAGQLQRNVITQTRSLPYIWVAASGLGTLVRIDTETGAILGEYRAAPENHFDNGGLHSINGSPSRTTVDLEGNVWAGNRNEPANFDQLGSIVKIGSVIGGHRVDASGLPDANGEYLAPPFKYCECEDRDGDGLIHTSSGLGNVLPWGNVNGIDDDGGVASAEDECILKYARLGPKYIRTIAVDKENNLWVGGYATADRRHVKVDGFTASAIPGAQFQYGLGGYGGLLDCAGRLWSASYNGDLLLVDTANVANHWSVASENNISYGLAIDTNGFIWMTNEGGNRVHKIEPTPPGTVVGRFDTGSEAGDRGVAVRPQDNSVWVANSAGTTVTRLDNNGGNAVDIQLGSDGQFPTGVAVDAGGKAWVTNRYAGQFHVMRIDPATNQVDLQVELRSGAEPYNYSDMTGLVTLETTGTGTWVIIHDSYRNGTFWGCVSWNEGFSDDPRLEVSIRTAERQTDLAKKRYVRVENGIGLCADCNFVGRYIEVRVRFNGSCPGAAFSSPILHDLSVRPLTNCVEGNCNFDSFNKVNGDDIQPFVRVYIGGEMCSLLRCAADMDRDGHVTSVDWACFIEKLLTGRSSCEDASYRCGTPATPTPRAGDCNGNGIADASDVLSGDYPDCNHNFIPDGCDINSGDPDGDGHVSNDVDGNGVPDECQPDCNHNNVPDAKDIADATSADVNYNGVPDSCEADCNQNSVPDAWDISQHTSADCNANGIPDSCEADCNSNGVPDDCDIDPTDPDGDSVVYPDCNNSSLPDECDFDLPLRPSYDCNENGIPDECDIASAYSQDANQNGVPDECDYVLGRSAGESAVDEEAAWLAFYEWQIDEHAALSAMSPVERFEATVDMLRELGLPEAIPWARVNAP